MYELLARGAFGNTVPIWLDVDSWEADPQARPYLLWGVRSSVRPGHPAMRLYCPRAEVAAYARQHFADGVNISVMVDVLRTVTLYADVQEQPGGLVVYGVPYPGKGASWRTAFRERGQHWEGLRAKVLLEKHLNSASLDDLYAVLERWPDHVVELSALDRPFGTIPGRNGVVWECRLY